MVFNGAGFGTVVINAIFFRVEGINTIYLPFSFGDSRNTAAHIITAVNMSVSTDIAQIQKQGRIGDQRKGFVDV